MPPYVADVKQARRLGGGGAEDLEEGILTLPAALAIRDPYIAELFCKETRTEAEKGILLGAYNAQLENAVSELRTIGQMAKTEARAAQVRASGHLISLVDHVLSLTS